MKKRVVIIRHTFKNALIPVVSLIGLQLPILLGGAVNLFNLLGIDRLLVNEGDLSPFFCCFSVGQWLNHPIVLLITVIGIP